MVEDIIREAMDRGDFDNLPGKGKPLNLAQDPLLDPMTAIVIRILRDNGLSHPLIEARKAIAAEAEQCRAELARAWREYQRFQSEERTGRGGGPPGGWKLGPAASPCALSPDDAWAEAVAHFRARVREVNREVRMFNLKSPSPTLHGLALDADAEVRNATNDPTSK